LDGVFVELLLLVLRADYPDYQGVIDGVVCTQEVNIVLDLPEQLFAVFRVQLDRWALHEVEIFFNYWALFFGLGEAAASGTFEIKLLSDLFIDIEYIPHDQEIVLSLTFTASSVLHNLMQPIEPANKRFWVHYQVMVIIS
jgi:hypothetical protein